MRAPATQRRQIGVGPSGWPIASRALLIRHENQNVGLVEHWRGSRNQIPDPTVSRASQHCAQPTEPRKFEKLSPIHDATEPRIYTPSKDQWRRPFAGSSERRPIETERSFIIYYEGALYNIGANAKACVQPRSDATCAGIAFSLYRDEFEILFLRRLNCIKRDGEGSQTRGCILYGCGLTPIRRVR